MTTKTKIEQMNIVIAGHVDHGKSTVIGRLLADTDTLPDGKLEQVKENCRLNAKPFEYAFLIDALKDEQAQGITIDSARVFFNTKKRNYIIIDAPGHIEFLKNMVSGASRAEAALLVIDANEGIQENSRRHGYMLAMLGIRQFTVLVNKMDLIDYDQQKYESIVSEYNKFLAEINIECDAFIPVSGREGDNIATLSKNTPWYKSHTVLEQVDEFRKEPPLVDSVFRMPVQDVYKFTAGGDDRRIVAGTVESGKIRKNDQVVFYPSGKRSTIKSIEGFNEDTGDIAKVDKATGFTITEQIYVNRGEIAVNADEIAPMVGKRLQANIFWLGRSSLSLNKSYHLKLGTAKIQMRIEKINKVLNASNLEASDEAPEVKRHEVAECIIRLAKPLAFDTIDQHPKTSRFVIVDEYEIAGGGIITAKLEDELSDIRDKVILRNFKWERSHITPLQRAEKYSQKSALIILTGQTKVGKKEVAKQLEEQLFGDGKQVYFLGIGNLLYGVDADIKRETDHREEHIRRLAEVAHILLDSGAILIVTAVDLNQHDLEILKTIVSTEKIKVIWVGDSVSTDLAIDKRVPGLRDVDQSVGIVREVLYEEGIIFNPWQ
jgi:bifunctional enzyme CysN/CysC